MCLRLNSEPNFQPAPQSQSGPQPQPSARSCTLLLTPTVAPARSLPRQVCARIRELVLSLEEEREGQCIVLTSHADTLQISQCYVAGADPRSFSMYRFKNGRRSTLERLVPAAAERATGGPGRPAACTRRPAGL